MKSEYTQKGRLLPSFLLSSGDFLSLVIILSGIPSCFPFGKFPLPFLAFVVGEDIRQEDSGDGFDFVLRDAAVVDQPLPPAQMLPPKCFSIRVNLFLRVFRVSYRIHPILIKIKMQLPVKQIACRSCICLCSFSLPQKRKSVKRVGRRYFFTLTKQDDTTFAHPIIVILSLRFFRESDTL